jgi:hypothetical protein
LTRIFVGVGWADMRHPFVMVGSLFAFGLGA